MLMLENDSREEIVILWGMFLEDFKDDNFWSPNLGFSIKSTPGSG